MQLFLRKAASNTNVSSHFRVGADAYIGPLGSCEFAENLRENGAFCRADVGIGPYKQVGSCGTNSHWAFASCNCLLRTSQSASLTAPLSGEPGALPRQVHAREKLQLISRLPQWGQMASSMSCRSPQAEQVFWRIKRSCPSKTPSALASRGRTIAVPPLVCRFLAEAALRSADTPLRDNGRTRHTPTARNRVSEGSSGMYSPDAVCFLAPTESSL